MVEKVRHKKKEKLMNMTTQQEEEDLRMIAKKTRNSDIYDNPPKVRMRSLEYKLNSTWDNLHNLQQVIMNERKEKKLK